VTDNHDDLLLLSEEQTTGEPLSQPVQNDDPQLLESGNRTRSEVAPDEASNLTDLQWLLGLELQPSSKADNEIFDWNSVLDLDLPSAANLPWETALAASPPAEDIEIAPDGNLRPTKDPIHYIQQLADLNVRLYENAKSLPPVATGPTATKLPSMEGRLFAIDETFKMTQTLVDIANELYPRARPASHSAPDQATVLLLLSCANRVCDTYEVLLGHMRGCLEHKACPTYPDGKTVQLPQFRIGNYAPPGPTAIAMHMLMFILMAANLFDQFQEVLGIWRPNKHGVAEGAIRSNNDAFGIETPGGRSHFPDFSQEAKSEVSRRARAVAVDIVRTREQILGLIKTPVAGLVGRMIPVP